MVARALGDEGFQMFQTENGQQENYTLSSRQAEAIVSMQLGSLANLEREQLGGEHRKLLEDIAGFLHLLSDEGHILALIREEMEELKKKYNDPRRTDISEEELTDVDRDDLIAEESMVVVFSQRGYIKRTQLSVYQAQNRGGKGIMGAKNDEEDPVEHVFVSSTHAYLLFFTNRGKVYWQKVYDLPLQSRTAKGRALVNLLQLGENERVSQCLAVRDFDEEHFLIKATRKGLVKKTVLSAYGRPLKGGLIAINLDEDDELIDVRIVSKEDDVLLATREGMCIRFSAEDARAMGRETRGVKGIKLGKGDEVVGMVVAEEEGTLLTVCENGYGKRTPFGPGDINEEMEIDEELDTEADENAAEEEVAKYSGNVRYRRQNRGGKGLRDIKTTKRNGKVIDILAVADDDEVLMVTGGGKIQRVRASDISQVGRNTQGVRVIRLDEDDKFVSIARIPAMIVDESELSPLVNDEETPGNDQTIVEEARTETEETQPPEAPDAEPSE